MFELLSEEIRKKYNIQIDYVLIHCANPNCDQHWGVSLSTKGNQILTSRDLICQKCAADKRAKEI